MCTYTNRAHNAQVNMTEHWVTKLVTLNPLHEATFNMVSNSNFDSITIRPD